MKQDDPSELSAPKAELPQSQDDGTATNYVPESETREVRLSPWSAKSILAAFVMVPTICMFIYMYSQNRVQRAEADITVKDTQIQLLQEQHEAVLSAREEVFDAKLDAERQKGFYAHYVQPVFDWFGSSDVSVDAGPVSVEIKPDNE